MVTLSAVVSPQSEDGDLLVDKYVYSLCNSYLSLVVGAPYCAGFVCIIYFSGAVYKLIIYGCLCTRVSPKRFSLLMRHCNSL